MWSLSNPWVVGEGKLTDDSFSYFRLLTARKVTMIVKIDTPIAEYVMLDPASSSSGVVTCYAWVKT